MAVVVWWKGRSLVGGCRRVCREKEDDVVRSLSGCLCTLTMIRKWTALACWSLELKFYASR